MRRENVKNIQKINRICFVWGGELKLQVPFLLEMFIDVTWFHFSKKKKGAPPPPLPKGLKKKTLFIVLKLIWTGVKADRVGRVCLSRQGRLCL